MTSRAVDGGSLRECVQHVQTRGAATSADTFHSHCSLHVLCIVCLFFCLFIELPCREKQHFTVTSLVECFRACFHSTDGCGGWVWLQSVLCFTWTRLKAVEKNNIIIYLYNCKSVDEGSQ